MSNDQVDASVFRNHDAVKTATILSESAFDPKVISINDAKPIPLGGRHQLPDVDIDISSDRQNPQGDRHDSDSLFGPNAKLESSLHKSCEDAVDSKMTPEERKQYQEEKAKLDAQWDRWVLTGMRGHPPSSKDYPMVSERERRVEQMEKEVQIQVLKSMSPEERRKLGREMNEWLSQCREMDSNPALSMLGRPEPPQSVKDFYERCNREAGKRGGQDGSASDLDAAELRDAKNSLTHVEGEVVSKDKNGNIVIDRSKIADLPDNYPVKETIMKDGSGVEYEYKGGTKIKVSGTQILREEFDPQSGSMIWVPIGGEGSVFNPLL